MNGMAIIIVALALLIIWLVVRFTWIYLTEPDDDDEDLSGMSNEDLQIESYFEAAGGNWPNVYSQELARRRHVS